MNVPVMSLNLNKFELSKVYNRVKENFNDVITPNWYLWLKSALYKDLSMIENCNKNNNEDNILKVLLEDVAKLSGFTSKQSVMIDFNYNESVLNIVSYDQTGAKDSKGRALRILSKVSNNELIKAIGKYLSYAIPVVMPNYFSRLIDALSGVNNYDDVIIRGPINLIELCFHARVTLSPSSLTSLDKLGFYVPHFTLSSLVLIHKLSLSNSVSKGVADNLIPSQHWKLGILTNPYGSFHISKNTVSVSRFKQDRNISLLFTSGGESKFEEYSMDDGSDVLGFNDVVPKDDVVLTTPIQSVVVSAPQVLDFLG